MAPSAHKLKYKKIKESEIYRSETGGPTINPKGRPTYDLILAKVKKNIFNA